MPSIEGLPLWISVSILLFYIIIKDGSSLWGFLTGNNVKNATMKERLSTLEEQVTKCENDKIYYSTKLKELEDAYKRELQLKEEVMHELQLVTEKQKVVIESTIAQLRDGESTFEKVPVVNRLLENLQKYVD